MTYIEFINSILEQRHNEKDADNYLELHHILPRSCGGSDDSNNLIYLYPQEHYEAHKLLALENPENSALQYAWWMMSNVWSKFNEGRTLIEVSSEDYAKSKELMTLTTSKRLKGTHQTPEHIKHRSEARVGKKLSPLHIENMRKAMTGKMSGSDNPFYGKHHSEETKKILHDNHLGKYDGPKNPSAKAVYCLNNDKIFLTMREAAIYAGVEKTGSNICSCCKGKMLTSGHDPITGEKLKWRYATKEEIENFNKSVETAGDVQQCAS